jgi:hypothetical protein
MATFVIEPDGFQSIGVDVYSGSRVYLNQSGALVGITVDSLRELLREVDADPDGPNAGREVTAIVDESGDRGVREDFDRIRDALGVSRYEYEGGAK